MSSREPRRSPEEISALLGLRPDRTWKIGDTGAKTDILDRTHGWVVNSRLNNVGFDVETHLEGDWVTVHLAIYSESRILMSFEPHIPRLIGLFDAQFDVEIYFLPP